MRRCTFSSSTSRDKIDNHTRPSFRGRFKARIEAAILLQGVAPPGTGSHATAGNAQRHRLSGGCRSATKDSRRPFYSSASRRNQWRTGRTVVSSGKFRDRRRRPRYERARSSAERPQGFGSNCQSKGRSSRRFLDLYLATDRFGGGSASATSRFRSAAGERGFFV